MQLTADQVKAVKVSGSYSDGGGLYLHVVASGTKSWIYRYQIAKRRREMGLGGYPKLTLAKARLQRDFHRKQVKVGIDPLEVKRAATEQAVENRRQSKTLEMTFKRCAEAYIGQKEHGWSSHKHGQQWRNTLTTYAYPVIGELPVAHIDTQEVLEILQPIWLNKTETATRVRNRIELVLDYAGALKYRTGDNPARWRGNLANLLASPSKIREVKHHSAIPYDDISEFLVKLSNSKGLAARALTLTILAATRTSETLNATWNEFDLTKGVWTIPKSRMKGSRPHRIPLSEPAVVLLKNLETGSGSDYVFPGMKKGKALSNMSMTTVLRRMDRGDLTVHGFRSTFRDWAAEKTSYSWRVAESALAHKLKDGTEAAYQRGDLLDKRVEMMDAWARYCFPEKSKVVKMRRA